MVALSEFKGSCANIVREKGGRHKTYQRCRAQGRALQNAMAHSICAKWVAQLQGRQR